MLSLTIVNSELTILEVDLMFYEYIYYSNYF